LKNKNIIWLDPTNNDPQFIDLLSSILVSEGFKLELITVFRKGFSFGNAPINYFLPKSLIKKYNNKIVEIVRIIILLFLYPIKYIYAIKKIYKQNSYVLYSSSNWFYPLDIIALAIIKMLKIKLFIIIHNPTISAKRRLYISEKYYFNKGNRYICLSEYSKNIIIKHHKINPDNIYIIHHPNFNKVYNKVLIDGRFTTDNSANIDKIKILYMSRVARSNGLELFSNVIDELIDDDLYHFILAGNAKGVRAKTLRKKIEKKYKNRINVTCVFGFYSEEKAKSLITTSDYVVLPYEYAIAQSGLRQLALGLGTPVIVNRIGGLYENILNWENGIIVKKNTVEEWVNTLKLLSTFKYDRDKIKKVNEYKYGEKATIISFNNIFSIE
jgi:glycosyltransferase involved in cell wall biosynthesis